MLKIKDSVDLKELEKFGFEIKKYSNGEIYEKNISNSKQVFKSYVISSDRIIHYNIMCVNNTMDSMIYDLIQAGLVEKVSD